MVSNLTRDFENGKRPEVRIKMCKFRENRYRDLLIENKLKIDLINWFAT